MTITNDKGRKFFVRVVAKGDRYGLNDCLTHKDVDPLIEFYDVTYTKGFSPRGQFVSSYYARTLADVRGGLNLHGGVVEWRIDAEALAPVLELARGLSNG